MNRTVAQTCAHSELLKVVELLQLPLTDFEDVQIAKLEQNCML